MLKKYVLSAMSVTLLAGSLFGGVKKWEITPMVGKKLYNYSDDKPRFDDSKPVLGGRLNAYVTDTVSLQLGVEGSKDNPIYMPGREGAKTDLLRGMASIQKDLPNRSRVTPYIFGGLGGEKVYKTVKSTNLDSQMFYNGGVGLRYSVNPKVDLVAETRVIHKVEDSDTDIIGNVGVGYKIGGRVEAPKRPVKTLDDLRAQLPKVTPAPIVEPATPVIEESEVEEVEPIIAGSIDEKEGAVVNGEVDNGCAPSSVEDTCPSSRDDSGSSDMIESGYYVQVISLKRNSTDAITSRLEKLGFGYKLENNGNMVRVLVGPYSSKSGAKRALRRLKRVKRDSFITHR